MTFQTTALPHTRPTLLRAALVATPPPTELWRHVLIGAPEREATCPLRHRIVGTYRPHDGVRLTAMAAVSGVAGALTMLGAMRVDMWMQYLDRLLAVFT